MAPATPRCAEALSFAKTGAALLSVTIATVSGVGRPDGRGGWHGWRSEAPCVRAHVSCRDVHRAADEVTSGGASFVTVVQAADFSECDHITLGDALHGSRRCRVFRQREVRARSVIVRTIARQDSTQMLFTEHHHVIQAVAPD
jgi:hypothetical protein